MKVLITGASSGIGKELAKVYSQQGYDCLLTALEEGELTACVRALKQETPSVVIESFTLDLSIPGSARMLYDHCVEIDWLPDVLINNAGFGTYGYITDIPIERELAMMQLHMIELYQMTRYFLEHMLMNDRGYIINMSSISAFQPSPMLTTYGATKAFVYQFTRGLQFELKQKGSKVLAMAVSPTPVRTRFGQDTGLVNTTLFNSWMTVEAPMVARAIYNAMTHNRSFIIPGRFYHFMSKISRRLPEKFQIWLSYQHLKQRQF